MPHYAARYQKVTSIEAKTVQILLFCRQTANLLSHLMAGRGKEVKNPPKPAGKAGKGKDRGSEGQAKAKAKSKAGPVEPKAKNKAAAPSSSVEKPRIECLGSFICCCSFYLSSQAS